MDEKKARICLSNIVSSRSESVSCNSESTNDDSIVQINSLQIKPAETLGKSSFLDILRSYSSRDLIRADTIRQSALPSRLKHLGTKDILFIMLWILCGWLPMALDWTIFFIRDYSSSIPGRPADMVSETNSTNSSDVFVLSSSSWPTVAPTYFDYIFHGDEQDVLFTWTKLCSKALLFTPLTSTISLYIYTNLSSFSGRELVARLTIIYLSLIVISTPFTLLHLLYWSHTDVFIAGTMSFHLVLAFGWWLLTKTLSIEWRVNFKWIPALQCCKAVVFILCGITVQVDRLIIADVVMYIPLVLIVIEYIFKKVLEKTFHEYRENVLGLTYSIAHVAYPMELLRFISFVSLYIEYMVFDAPIVYMVMNGLFSITGEIYTHTHLWLVCNNELEVRIYGKRLESFPEVFEYYSSLRSCLEYVSPMFYTFHILFANMCRYHIPQMGQKMNYLYFHSTKGLLEDIWQILGVFYLFELAAELICWVIVKLFSYNRVSAIGRLKWPFLFTLIVYVGTEVDVPLNTSGLLSVLTLHNK